MAPIVNVWKGKMEDLLYVKDYYLPLFASEKPENKTDAEWNLLHLQVCGYIRQWIDDNVLNYVSEEKHAQSLWNKLKQLYFSLRTMVMFGKISPLSLCKVVEIANINLS